MSKRAEIVERMKNLNDAVEKGRGYLLNGDHGDWYGFRPLFGGSQGRLPHPDWVKNVFLPGIITELGRCTKALETVERKEKERRSSQKRKQLNGRDI